MNAVNEMRGARILAPVPLAMYGNPLMVYLASVRSAWEASLGKTATVIPGVDMCTDIPERFLFDQLRKRLFPPVIDDGSSAAIEANIIISFLNAKRGEDDPNILTLKQALNRLQQLSNQKDYRPLFVGNRFLPSLLDLTDDEDNT